MEENEPAQLREIIKKQADALKEILTFAECYCDADEYGTVQERCDACIHRKIAKKTLEGENHDALKN